jgi:hypothetical protein
VPSITTSLKGYLQWSVGLAAFKQKVQWVGEKGKIIRKPCFFPRLKAMNYGRVFAIDFPKKTNPMTQRTGLWGYEILENDPAAF